jgi:hypothetical protein
LKFLTKGFFRYQTHMVLESHGKNGFWDVHDLEIDDFLWPRWVAKGKTSFPKFRTINSPQLSGQQLLPPPNCDGWNTLFI